MFGADHLSVEDLDALTALLSASLKLKLVPGPEWAVELPRIYYPRAKILTMAAAEAVGKLWRTVQHAIDTRGELNGYDVAVDAVLAAEDLTGIRCVHPRFVLRLFLEAERERVEHIARSHAANLEYTYLPKRGNGWRAAVFEQEQIFVKTPARDAAEWWERAALAIGAVAAGTLLASDTPPDLELATIERQIVAMPHAATYDALQTAVEAIVPHLAAAYLRSLAEPEEEEKPSEPDENAAPETDEDQPADPQQSPSAGGGSSNAANDDPEDTESGQDQSVADDTQGTEPSKAAPDDEPGAKPGDSETSSQPTADGDPLPAESEAEDDGDAVVGAAQGENGEDASNAEAQADQEGANDDGHAAEPTTPTFDRETLKRIAGAILDELADEIGALGAGPLAIDYLEDEIVSTAEAKEREKTREEMVDAIAAAVAAGGWGPSAGNFVDDPNSPGPAWSGVARTNVALSGPLKRIIIQYLAENEIQELETGHTSGRLDMKRAFLPPALRPVPPFRRRAIVDERSYAIFLVLDRSGSTMAEVGEERYPDVFGPGKTRRWHLVARTGVALTDAFARVPNCDLGIITYDHEVNLVKRLGDPLSETIRQRVMDTVRARGDNDDAGALTTAVTQLGRSPREKKIVVFLTDGQFCSTVTEMNAAMTIAKRANVETIFLTLDCEPDFARRYVPDHLAERVDDDSLPSVLGRHLRRVIAA